MKGMKLTDFNEEEVKELFLKWMSEKHPEKMDFNPRIVSYNDEYLEFGMKKHYGVLSIPSERLLKDE